MMTAPKITPIDARAVPFTPEGPQPLLRPIPPGEAYPVEALGPLRGSVEAVQGQTLAPVAIPAASALTVAALAVQGHIDVETLAGPRPVSLYALTVAQSGERKSSCDAPLMAALRAFEKEQGKAQREEMAAWENAAALWKGDRDSILGEARKAKGKGRTTSEADLAALGIEPAPPPSPERTVTEPTFEGLTRKFSEGMPTLGIYSDEGGQFLGGFAMSQDNRQKTLAALNDLWQGNPIRRTRAGDGSITHYGRRLSVHLMTQPGVAEAFMADPMAADTGFLARCLICAPESQIGNRLQSAMRPDTLGAIPAFGERLRIILETPLPMDAITRELHPRVIPLAPAARTMLAAFADHVEAAQRPGGEFANVTGFASKAAEQAARIAGVLTAWADLGAPEVSARTMADAITLAQFYLTEARRLSDTAVISEKVKRAETLRKWLLDVWQFDDLTPSEIMQRAPIRALRESPAAKEAIAMLEKHGWLVRLPDGSEVRGKTRKDAYRIVRAGDEV